MSTLQGLEIVIAGASGGLGSATAELLSAEGTRLIAGYNRGEQRALKLASIATVVQADLTRAEDRARLLDAAPQLYALVVFTGEPARVKDPAELSGALGRSFEVNCQGPLLAAHEAAARMRAAGRSGSIVLFSTMQAVALFPGSTAYATAKAALQHGARLLAKEYRSHPQVRVNVIAPGVTAAGMAEASIASGKYDRLISEGVIPRFGRAMDVARAVRFLLEPDNYVTGQVLSVDGGATL